MVTRNHGTAWETWSRGTVVQDEERADNILRTLGRLINLYDQSNQEVLGTVGLGLEGAGAGSTGFVGRRTRHGRGRWTMFFASGAPGPRPRSARSGGMSLPASWQSLHLRIIKVGSWVPATRRPPCARTVQALDSAVGGS